jgi:cytochrome c oxidase subunit 3
MGEDSPRFDGNPMTAAALAGQARGADRHEDASFADDTATFGMWVFLATELLFFGALLFAYLHGRVHWPVGFGAASRHTDVLLGTVNTAVLLTSSAVLAIAAMAARMPDRQRLVARLLYASAALGMLFLAIKGIEYRNEWQEDLVPGPGFQLAAIPGAQLFFVLYFLMTSLHALHLAVGIVVLGIFARGNARGRSWATARRVHLAALYWHFVDVVWIFLYPLIYLVSRHG